MVLNVCCEHCGNDELQETNVIGIYYCKSCNEEIGFSELEIEVVNDMIYKIDEDKFIGEVVEKIGLKDFIILKQIVLKKYEYEKLIIAPMQMPLGRSLNEEK